MKARVARLMLSRRTWLALGIPVSALVAVCSIASVSFFPPSVRGKSLGYAVAGTQLYLGPRGGLVSTGLADAPQLFIEQGIALADQMSSPQLRNLMAAESGIPASQLAVDGPIDVNESIFQQEPNGQERASQITVQNAPYRVTIDEDTALPEILVTAQAPEPRQAVRLAGAAQTALSSYLTQIQTASKTPVAQRLGVSALGPVFLSDDARHSLANVAALAFLLSLALWCGLVVAIAAVVRDVRKLRRTRPGGRASLRGGQPLDLN